MAKEKEANPSISPITQVILRDRATCCLISWARFGFPLCCFLAILWGAKRCWFNSAQDSTTAWFKGCLWFMIRISITLGWQLSQLSWQWADVALFTWQKFAESLSGNRLSLGHDVTLKTMSVAFSDVSSNKKHQIWERAWDGGRQAIYILQNEATWEKYEWFSDVLPWGLVSHVTINATGLLRRFPEFPSFGWEKNIVRKSEYCVCGNQKA